MPESVSDYIAKAGISGVVCACVSAGLNPFDVTKIRLQNQSSSNIKYKGMICGIRTIFAEEGIVGLFRGVKASVLREITYSTVRMGAYEPIRSYFAHMMDISPKDTSPLLKFSSALISGGVGAAIANPFDLVKTRFQATMPGHELPYKTTFSAFGAIFRADGMAGLYRGWMVTSCRAAVVTSAQLGSYDSIKNNLLIHHLHVEEGFGMHFVASMAAGIITTTASNPIDVIKTRFMADRAGKYTSILHCVKDTYLHEGVKGFFKGWMPAYWRLGPHTVLSLLIIEKVREVFGLTTL